MGGGSRGWRGLQLAQVDLTVAGVGWGCVTFLGLVRVPSTSKRQSTLVGAAILSLVPLPAAPPRGRRGGGGGSRALVLAHASHARAAACMHSCIVWS